MELKERVCPLATGVPSVLETVNCATELKEKANNTNAESRIFFIIIEFK